MPEHASTPWVVWIMLPVWLALFGLGAWRHGQVVLHGADRPWSTRLFAAGYAVLGITGGLVFLLIPWQPAPAAITLPVGIGAVLILLLLVAGIATRTMETEQTRRRQRALGQPVPPRMVPPWLVGAGWFVFSVLALLAAGLVSYLLSWPQPVTEQSTFQGTFDLVLIVTTAVCLVGGAGHVYWQHRRRERARAQAVRRTETRGCCSPERGSQIEGDEAEDGEHADE